MTGAGDGWRYIAQRFDGTTGGFGQFLDFNVPLQGVSIEDVLSGHNGLSGTITPEYPRLKGADGQPILHEGGTAIWAEDPSGEIRGGGIVTHSDFGEEGSWDIECTALTGTSIDLPYDGADWFVNVDPLDLFRFIWTKIQSDARHNLGISIDQITSPIRLGTDLVQTVEFDLEPDVSAGLDDLEPAPAPVAPPRYATNGLWRDAAVKALKAKSWKDKQVDDALKKWLQKDALIEAKNWTPLTETERKIRDRAIETIGWPPNPPSPGTNQGTLVVNIRPQMNPPAGGEHESGTVDDTADEEVVTYQYDAYKLNWYSNLDLSSDLDSLASDTPFDWHLTSHWQDDEIRHHIRLGYPRLGRRREDLRFVVGENIQVVPSVERDGAEYANEVWVYGAGEGSLMVMGRAFRRDDGRIRKIVTMSDPTLKTQEACLARAEQEIAKRFNVDDISEITLTDHPHARMGSVDLGDEIYVQGELGWIDYAAWHRVVARSFQPDDGDSQVLTLIRSDRIA